MAGSGLVALLLHGAMNVDRVQGLVYFRSGWFNWSKWVQVGRKHRKAEAMREV